MDKQLGVMKLIHAYRFVGGRIADIDPLKRQEVPFIKELDHKHYGLADSDLETEFSTGLLPVNGQAAPSSRTSSLPSRQRTALGRR